MADEIVAGVESMSVGLEGDEDEVIDGKIVVKLPGDRKRRIAEAGGEARDRVEERGLVRAILVGPRSGVMGKEERGRVPSGPSVVWTGRGRGGRGRGCKFWVWIGGLRVWRMRERERRALLLVPFIFGFVPCGVGILTQTWSAVISHTRKRGMVLG